MSNKNYMTVPRFLTNKWTGGMGWIIALFFGALTWVMFWSLPGEDKVHMVIITVLAGILFGAVTVFGIRLIFSPLDKVRFTPEGVEIRMLGVCMKRIPRSQIRSVIGEIREYASGFKEYQIYTMRIYYETSKGKDRFVVVERTALSDEAVETYLPGITVLL